MYFFISPVMIFANSNDNDEQDPDVKQEMLKKTELELNYHPTETSNILYSEVNETESINGFEDSIKELQPDEEEEDTLEVTISDDTY